MLRLLLSALALALPLGSQAHPGALSSIEHFSHQISHQPNQQSPWLQRGSAYSNGGYYEQALADFEQAQALGDPVVVSFSLGVLYYRMQDLERAKKYFDEYLLAFPDHLACLEYRARLLRDMGDVDAAVADFRRFFALHRQPNPGHYISAAQLLRGSGPQGIDEALTLLDEGMAALGINSQLQKLAIELELERGHPDQALARQLSLQPQLGHSPKWKVDTAHLQIWLGNTDPARALLNQAKTQLQSMRATPARIELLARVGELEQDGHGMDR